MGSNPIPTNTRIAQLVERYTDNVEKAVHRCPKNGEKKKKPGLFAGSERQARQRGPNAKLHSGMGQQPRQRDKERSLKAGIKKDSRRPIQQTRKRKDNFSQQPGSAHAGWRITLGF